MILEALTSYVGTCPFLEGGQISAHVLAEEAVAYSVESIPEITAVRQYMDGTALRQFPFVLATKEYFSKDARDQLDICGFYEKFADWTQQQARNGVLPTLGSGAQACAVEVVSSQYVYQGTTENARFELQCRLLFEK